MKSEKEMTGMFIVILLVCAFSTESASEFPLVTDPSDQYDPAVYGNIVVWTDSRNGNEDIYRYNFLINEEFAITTDQNQQGHPAIHGDIVVWHDHRNGNYDIYEYNLSTESQLPITIDSPNQMNPAIYGDIVVWADDRNGNWDIYGYNLLTRGEFQITEESHDQYDPAIYEDVIVWTDTRNGNQDIYGYSLSTEEEFQITADTGTQSNPAIQGNIVVWKDDRNGTWDIYGYYLSTEEEFKIAVNTGDQESPAIFGDTVLWKDGRNGNWDIYGYKVSTKEEFQLTTDPYDQSAPSIFENVVVWADNRNGNSDIYGYDLLTKFPLIILIDKGYNGEYFVGDMLKVQWIASRETRITLSLKDADGKKLENFASNLTGAGSRGWTLKEKYGYGKKAVYAEFGSYSVEWVFYILRKAADIEVKVQDQDGQPISGAKVLLNGTLIASTDSSGVCLISEVGFGEHVIVVEFEGLEQIDRISIATTKEQSVDFVFTVEKEGKIHVRVSNQNGEPLENAEIYIDGTKKGYTLAEGVFEISVSEGSHTVEARWQNEGTTEQVEVKKNETTFVDLTINISRPDSDNVLYIALAAIGVVIAGLIVWAKMGRRKEEKEKEKAPRVLICPQCKNRIQEDWETCRYCGRKLK